MPFWSILLLALGGICLGGAWSLYRQSATWWSILLAVVLAGMAIAAAFLTVPQDAAASAVPSAGEPPAAESLGVTAPPAAVVLASTH